MKKYIYIFILFFTIGVTTSCNDDEFLEQVQESSLEGDNTFNTETQLDNVLVACYQHLRTMWIQQLTYYQYIRGMGTDFYTTSSSRTTAGFNDYSTLNSSTTLYYTYYRLYYKLIRHAETVLYYAENNDIEWDSDDDKAYIYAQAYAFIGIGYLNLGELYGGVPLVKELVTTAKYDYTRSSRVETYEYAIENFENALDGLPETTSSGGRLVKGVAEHYLSEAYLALGIAMEDEGSDATEAYTKAAEYASDVIDGGTYSLMTERFGDRADDDTYNVYWDLFREGNVNYQDGNTECIWAFQTDYDSYMDGDTRSLLDYPRTFGPYLRTLDGITGYDVSTLGGRGVAFNVPTMYLLKTIWEDDDGDIRNAECNIQRTLTYNDESSDLYGTTCSESDLYSCSIRGFAYPIFWKFSDPDDDYIYGTDDGVGYYANSYMFRAEYEIRLPETYLLRAEAYYRLGNSANAAKDINTVRERSEAADVSASDVDIDYILAERARELLGEEHRWNTLLRMSGTVFYDHFKAYNFSSDYYDVDWTNDFRSTLTEKINLWPIPQSVIDSNYGATIEQNDGW